MTKKVNLDEEGCLNMRWRRGTKVTYCKLQGQYRTVQYSTIKRHIVDKKGVGDVPGRAFS